MKPFDVTIPMATPNPLNQSHHGWKVAAGIRKRQRENVLKVVPRLDIEPVAEVTITRLSSGKLDDSNLGGALKAVQDAVAHRLGVDDASGLVQWKLEQAEAPRGEQAVRVQVRWLVAPTGAPISLTAVSEERLAGFSAKRREIYERDG